MDKSRRRFLMQSVAICGGTALSGWPGAGGSAAAATGAAIGSRAIADKWFLATIDAGMTATAAQVSTVGFAGTGWLPATVPGTVLTSLVNNGRYPDPLFARNMDDIPDTLARSSYWYRAEFDIPRAFDGQRIWLRFDGINYLAEIWVNGQQAGTLEGAFRHGYFDVTEAVAGKRKAALAVRIDPPPNPGTPHLFPLGRREPNGGEILKDMPTFGCTAGWDWIPTIRDRDIGIWAPVSLFATGSARLDQILVRSTPSLPDLRTASVRVQGRVTNSSAKPLEGTLKATVGGLIFSKRVTVDPNSSMIVDLPEQTMSNPKLWWPNGYGDPYLYDLDLAFSVDGVTLDEQTIRFGIRKVEYKRSGSDKFSIVVNGLPIFIKGGNWGMDEALKRIPRQRLDHQVRMQRDANYNMLRNWVGQSTGEDFYALCDQYGLMVWNDFFLSYEIGQAATNTTRYNDNVRDTLIHYRNHPSIVIWCGSNESAPPQDLADSVKALCKELDPDRLLLTASDNSDGLGITSGGPYFWQTPIKFFTDIEDNPNQWENTPFKNEIGSTSIPTIESVQSMLNKTSWERITNEWTQHNFHVDYRGQLAERYGEFKNLADFVRKAQLSNYESHRAIYEARIANMWKPLTGVLLWMSNATQPCFVWQIYSHDLEQHSTFYAVRNACEPVHVLMTLSKREVIVANHTTAVVAGSVRVRVFDLGSAVVSDQTLAVKAATAGHSTNVGRVDLPTGITANCFVYLEFTPTGQKQPISKNFYWYDSNGEDADYSPLNTMPTANVTATVTKAVPRGNNTVITLDLENPTSTIALMVHAQVVNRTTHARLLPATYSENYLTLLPGTKTTITIDAPGDAASQAIQLDGWNLGVQAGQGIGIPVTMNRNASPDAWPRTGLPM